MSSSPQKLVSNNLKPLLGQATAIAIIALLAARIFSSITPVLLKLGGSWVGENETVFWREAIGLIWFTVLEGSLIVFRRQFKKDSQPQSHYTGQSILFLLGAGIAATLYMLFGVWSLRFTSVTNCTVIDCTLPIFTILGGSLLFKQVFDRRFVMGAIIAVAGAFVIALADFSQSNGQLYGDALALFSTLFYAAYWLLVEELRARLNTSIILLWRCAVGTIMLIPILWLSAADRILPNSWQEWSLVVAIALFGQVLAQGLTVYSLKVLSSSLVALSMLVIPIFSHIEARFIFSEPTSFMNYLGCLSFYSECTWRFMARVGLKKALKSIQS
jgi:drug/metabolite transporter (DMT)-like permease